MADRSPSDPSLPPAPPSSWPATIRPSDAAPAAPPERPPSMRGAGPIMVAALVFAVVVTYGLGLALAHENRRRTEPSLAPTDDPFDSGPTTTAPEVFRPTLSQVMPSLVDFVERTRGHTFDRAPTAVAMTAAGYRTAVAAWVARRSSVIDGVAALQATLAAPGTRSAAATFERALVAEYPVAYDSLTNRLAVRTSDGTVTPFIRGEIVRQLTRALDAELTQRAASALDALGTETDFGERVVAEGSAAWVAGRYQSTMAEADLQAYARESAAADRAAPSTGAGQVLWGLDQLPRQLGTQWVSEVVQDGGTAALDDRLTDPPATSAQVLAGPGTPTGTAPDVRVQPLAAPTADTKAVASGPFGAADLLAAVAPNASDPHSPLVIDWHGGRYVLWRAASGGLCARFRVVGGSAAETVALRGAIRQWGTTATDATIESVTDPAATTSDHQVVQVTRCA